MLKLKEIDDLKQLNLEWEQKTKEILYEIQQNDLILEKKEFERNLQLDEYYQLIAQQEEQIQTLTMQLQYQAKKEQAALAQAKLNIRGSLIGGASFIGVSRGQSFVLASAIGGDPTSPYKKERVEVEYMDNFSDHQADQRPSVTDNSPEKSDLPGDMQGFDEL